MFAVRRLASAWASALASAIALAWTASPSAAQDVASTRVSGAMGTVTVDGEQLYRMCVRPDISLGNWGLALDLELFVDADGGLSSHGWDCRNRTQALDSFLRKIYHVRYGEPGDRVHLRLGALDDVTLGYGLIMDRYRNTVHYPGIKKTGVVFECQGLAGSGVSLQGMVNNVQDLAAGGAIVGLRAAAQPLGKFEVGVTCVVDFDQYGGLLDRDGDGYPDAVDAFPTDKRRALDNDRDGTEDAADADDDNDGVIDIDAGSGLRADVVRDLLGLNATYGDALFPLDGTVARQQPFNRDRVEADRFGVVGLDATYPLIDEPALAVRLYGQGALLLDDDDALSAAEALDQGVVPGNARAEGWGLALPGVWARTGPLCGQLEYRYFHDQFDAGHFDNLYELDRARLDLGSGRVQAKDARLAREADLSGVFGRATADVGQFVQAGAAYQYLAGGDEPKQEVRAEAELSPRALARVPRLRAARAYYQKNNIGARLNRAGTGDDGFFESTEDTFYGYALGLELAGEVTVVWDTRYVFARGADGRLQRRKVLGIETVFFF